MRTPKILIYYLIFSSIFLFSNCENAPTYEVYCQIIAECGPNGHPETYIGTSVYICYCACDEGWYGKSCQYQKEDCKGILKPLDENGDIDACKCECVGLGIVNFDPPNCSSIKLNLKASDSQSKQRSAETADYFPLNQSNTWFFNTLDSLGEVDSEFGFSVEREYHFGDTTYIPISVYVPDSLGTGLDTFPDRYFEIDDKENEIYTAVNDTTGEVFLYHNYNIGDTVIRDIDTAFVYDWGSIEVPAGIFQNCIGFIDPDSSGVILAPDVGLVAYLGDSTIFAELKSYELYCSYSVLLTVENESCPGAGDGAFGLEVIGDTTGMSDLTYLWDGPSDIPDGSNPVNLSSGYYSLTVSNDQCEASIDSLFIAAPEAIGISLDTVNHVSCFGDSDGAIEVSFSGGNGTLEFTWNDGEFNSPDLSGLQAGNYTLDVTDTLGCTSSLIVEIEEPNMLTSIPSLVHISCYGSTDGAIDPNILGGNGTYAYLWNNGSTAAEIENLPEGNYKLSVVDTLGCTAEFSYDIVEPDSLIVNSISLDNACYGDSTGSIVLDISGGTEPYQVAWSNFESGDSITNLGAGIYLALIADENGCIVNHSAAINQPDSLSLILSSTEAQAGMADGSATVEVNGGTAPYTYLWNDELNQTTAVATNLIAGDYTVIVTDANGCSQTAVVNVAMSTHTNDLINSTQLLLYPSPAKDYVNVDFVSESLRIYQISCINLDGKFVKQNIYNGLRKTQFDLKDLNAGVYYLRIKTHDGILTKAFIKVD